MKIIKGKGLGRKLGFPTINLGKQKFESGVFAARVTLEEKKYWGAMHVGADGYTEIHLLDFEGDAYGKDVEVEVRDKIRETWKFENLENLKNQIELDVNLISEQVTDNSEQRG